MKRFALFPFLIFCISLTARESIACLDRLDRMTDREKLTEIPKKGESCLQFSGMTAEPVPMTRFRS